MVQLTDLELSLDRDTPMPLYQQLRSQLAQLIQTRRLPPGTRLPPRRELAAYLGVNRATVASAYDRLVADGLARARVGQGTFVTGQRGSPAGPARLRWPLSQAMEAVARRPRPTRPTTEHPDPIDFASLVPDERLFPIERFREVLNDVLQREGKQLLQYGPAGGYPPLRDYIAHRLGEQGIATGAEEILIVNGSQQGLDLVFRALVDPGDTVAVESPTYSAVLPVLAQYQARVLRFP